MVEDTEWLFAVDREGDSGEGGEEAVGVEVLGEHVHELDRANLMQMD